MTYRVVVAHEAEKTLDRLDRPTEQRIRARFLQLAENPFDPRLSAPLTERAGVRKSRVGGCGRLPPGLVAPQSCIATTKMGVSDSRTITRKGKHP